MHAFMWMIFKVKWRKDRNTEVGDLCYIQTCAQFLVQDIGKDVFQEPFLYPDWSGFNGSLDCGPLSQ